MKYHQFTPVTIYCTLGLAQVYNISDHCVVAILELLTSDCQRFLNQSRMCLYNRPFYRYGGHIELKEYYGMPRGHEHDLIYSHQYLRALFGSIFL